MDWQTAIGFLDKRYSTGWPTADKPDTGISTDRPPERFPALAISVEIGVIAATAIHALLHRPESMAQLVTNTTILLMTGANFVCLYLAVGFWLQEQLPETRSARSGLGLALMLVAILLTWWSVSRSSVFQDLTAPYVSAQRVEIGE